MGEFTEHGEPQEPVERELARLLKERGPSDPEVLAKLNTWGIEQERIADLSEGDARHLAQAHMHMNTARLYSEAGRIHDALEAYDDARAIATNIGDDELCNHILAEMDLIDPPIANE